MCRCRSLCETALRVYGQSWMGGRILHVTYCSEYGRNLAKQVEKC